jgi:hypothetical protein
MVEAGLSQGDEIRVLVLKNAEAEADADWILK